MNSLQTDKDYAEKDSDQMEIQAYRKVILGLVLGILSIGGVAGTGVFRLDKFGRSDYTTAITSHIEYEKLEHRALVSEILTELNKVVNVEIKERNQNHQLIWDRLNRLESRQEFIIEKQNATILELKRHAITVKPIRE